MKSSDFEYRFGWRWLLPACNGDATCSVGLSADEQQWWQHTQSLTLVLSSAKHVDGYLIALDTIDQNTIIHQINDSSPNWLCAWGNGTAIDRLHTSLSGFTLVRKYALLPTTQPRVVVPLSSPRFAEAGLRLHRPGRKLTQLGILLARGLAKLGYYGLLKRRVLLIATREKNVLPQGMMRIDVSTNSLDKILDFALYLGTPDDNRKTVVLPLTDTLSSVILKTAEMPNARTSLQNEANALTIMRQTPLVECVPKLISLVNIGERLTLIQEYRQRRTIDNDRMIEAVVNFLVGLFEIERKHLTLAEWLLGEGATEFREISKSLSPCVEQSALKLRSYITELADRGTYIWTHRNHGDFAPWNCTWTDRGLFIFDWEDSGNNAIALSDAFYYVLSPFVHVQKKPNAEKALVIAIEFASNVIKQSVWKREIDKVFDPISYTKADVKVYLAIWLLDRLKLSPFYGELLIQLEQSW